MSLDQIKQFRECIKCVFRSLEGDDELIFKGILLHILGDTYGHLTLRPIYDPRGPYQTDPKVWRNANPDQRPGELIDYKDTEEGSSASNSLTGHGLDGEVPDYISARPNLAKQYIRDIYYLGGGSSPEGNDRLNAIMNMIDTIANKKMNNNDSYQQLLALNNKKMFEYSDVLKAYEPKESSDGTVLPSKYQDIGVGQVNASQMQQLIEMLRSKCPQLKGVL